MTDSKVASSPESLRRQSRHAPAAAGFSRTLGELEPDALMKLVGWGQRSFAGDLSAIYAQYGVGQSVLTLIGKSTKYTLGKQVDPLGVSYPTSDKGAGALTEALLYARGAPDESNAQLAQESIRNLARIYAAWSTNYYAKKLEVAVFATVACAWLPVDRQNGWLGILGGWDLETFSARGSGILQEELQAVALGEGIAACDLD